MQDGEGELNTEDYLIEAGPAASSAQEEHSEHQDSSASHEEGGQADSMDPRERDRLWKHLRDNSENIRAFCDHMVTQIPIPEQCIIEGTQLNQRWLFRALGSAALQIRQPCLAKLMKCLYFLKLHWYWINFLSWRRTVVITGDVNRQFPSRDQQRVILFTSTFYCTLLTTLSTCFLEMTI